MPHLRPRHLDHVLLKSLRFWPVVCLVGSRQVGKSTLLRRLDGYRYLTFDDDGTAALAERNPKEMLEPPCVIDEAQKVPRVFDAVKLDVDRERKPGKYILTGSVRFSRRALIRESLTGRAKTLQMFPLTCAETLGLKFEDRWVATKTGSEAKRRVSRKDLQRHLSKGGMPAIFSARSQSETISYWNSLIESYVYRDLLLAVPKNAKPPIAMAVLRAIAEILGLGERPTFARILNKVGGTRTQLERHVQGLEDMMIINRLSHWKASAAKDIFLPFDPALFLTLLKIDSASHDAAIHSACLHITLINEALAQAQAADRAIDLRYAVSPQGEMIHLILPGTKGCPIFWKISGDPVPHSYSLRFLTALSKNEGGLARVLSSTESAFRQGSIHVLPWETVL
jgi:predicted AAA+ superfamily ATPase